MMRIPFSLRQGLMSSLTSYNFDEAILSGINQLLQVNVSFYLHLQ